MSRDENTQTRSTFVSVIAWIFIAISGFMLFASIMQNIMINLVFPLDEMQEAMNSPEAQENMPPLFAAIFSSFRLIALAFLVVAVAELVAAIGLLNRKNWARLLFIGMMALGIIWNLSGVVMQHIVLSSFLEMPETPGPGPDFEIFMTVMKVFSWVIALGMSALFAWIIKRLVSPAVRQEFGVVK